MMWYNEDQDEHIVSIGARTSIRVTEKLYEKQSDFQKIEIYQTDTFGKMMVLDNCIMLTDANEFAYHEMIAHVPLFAHPNPERVLIIGGGDGGTAREVLRHPQVKECVMVEIDEEVINVSREHFPAIACELDNPRLDLRIEDGMAYIRNNENAFDVILIDSTDPVGIAENLITVKFYEETHRSLKQGGIMVAQAESAFYFADIQRKLFKNIKGAFPAVSMYLSQIPFYPSGTWSFAFATKEADFDRSNYRAADLQAMESQLQYFNEAVFNGCFAIPTFARKIIE